MTYPELEGNLTSPDVLLGGPCCGAGVETEGGCVYLPDELQKAYDWDKPETFGLAGYYPTDEFDNYLRRVWRWQDPREVKT